MGSPHFRRDVYFLDLPQPRSRKLKRPRYVRISFGSAYMALESTPGQGEDAWPEIGARLLAGVQEDLRETVRRCAEILHGRTEHNYSKSILLTLYSVKKCIIESY